MRRKPKLAIWLWLGWLLAMAGCATVHPIAETNTPAPVGLWEGCGGESVDWTQRVQMAPDLDTVFRQLMELHDFGSLEDFSLADIREMAAMQGAKRDCTKGLMPLWLPGQGFEIREAVLVASAPHGGCLFIPHFLESSRQFQCYPETYSQVRYVQGVEVAQLTHLVNILIGFDDDGNPCPDIESPECITGCEYAERVDVAVVMDPATGAIKVHQWKALLEEGGEGVDPVSRCHGTGAKPSLR